MIRMDAAYYVLWKTMAKINSDKAIIGTSQLEYFIDIVVKIRSIAEIENL
jgi:hypothetical protein